MGRYLISLAGCIVIERSEKEEKREEGEKKEREKRGEKIHKFKPFNFQALFSLASSLEVHLYIERVITFSRAL